VEYETCLEAIKNTQATFRWARSLEGRVLRLQRESYQLTSRNLPYPDNPDWQLFGTRAGARSLFSYTCWRKCASIRDPIFSDIRWTARGR
jgi:hypothetical protein